MQLLARGGEPGDEASTFVSTVRVHVHLKKLSWWGQTSQQSLDSGCFELIISSAGNTYIV